MQIRLHPFYKAENDLLITALAAGVTSSSFPRVEISLNSFLRELSRECKKVTKSLTSNSEVSNPVQIDSAVWGKSKSWKRVEIFAVHFHHLLSVTWLTGKRLQ